MKKIFIIHYLIFHVLLSISCFAQNSTLIGSYAGGDYVNSNYFSGCITNGRVIFSTKEKPTNYSGSDFYNTRLNGGYFGYATMHNVNFTHAQFYSVEFTHTDMRGSFSNSEQNLGLNTIKTKNAIWWDGEIKSFSMSSVEDNFSIRKYVPATTDGAMINAKITNDASISGGAVLTLEEGAVLEVSSGKTLTVSDNGEIVFDVDAATDDTNIILNSGSKLVFGDNSKLTINLTGEVSETDPLHFTVIKAADDSYVLGLDTLPKDNIILNVNGTAYDTGKWGINFDPTTGNLDINVNVPEPASCALALGALAIAFAFMRRRR